MGKIDVSSVTKSGDSDHRRVCTPTWEGKERREEGGGGSPLTSVRLSSEKLDGHRSGLHGGFSTIVTDWISDLWWKGERKDLLLK